MINKVALQQALISGKDTPEYERFMSHVRALGGSKVFNTMPVNLYNYMQALIHGRRIKPDEESETILCQVNNVLDVAGVNFDGVQIFMRRIQRTNAPDITQALRNINVKAA